MAFKNTVRILIAAALLILLVSCGKDRTGDYTLLSPIVNPGEELSGDDFLMVSAFSGSSYTATLEDDAPTREPGQYTAEVTVTDGRGFSQTYSCRYTVRSYLYDSVRVEMGTPVTVDTFINKSIGTYADHKYEFEDARAVAALELGTHDINIFVDGEPYGVILILEDTTPPTAKPVTVHITAAAAAPLAKDFVADIVDATSVACTFKEEYNFNTAEDVFVTIVLTDQAGNVTEIQSVATCTIDTTPPVINGVHDITVTVGGTALYREGITVTDDSGEVPQLKVDNQRVNLNAVGTYEITYSATDSSGNTTVVHATVHVVEEPKVPEADMRALAKKIYNEEIVTSADMTKWDIAYAIYTWTRDNIKYTTDKVDKNDPVGAAYDGMTQHKGDCFTYMVVAREMLDLAGIPCRQITRLQYEGESAHYWLLVDIGDGWYHFDSCWHFTNKPFESFMRTDAELEEYCKKYDLEYYYRFDKSKYPPRATASYYDAE